MNLNFKVIDRSQKLSINILLSLLFNGLTMLLSMALIPITIDLLDKEMYAIWLVLTSIIAWFSIMDIGIASGLKNKLVASFSDRNIALSRVFISTAYFLLSIIALVVIIVYLVAIFFTDITKFFFTSSPLNREDLLISVSILLISFLLKLVFQLIVVVITAKQFPFIGSLVNFVSNFFIFCSILVLSHTEGRVSLASVSAIYGIIPVFVLLFGSFIYFSTYGKHYAPLYSVVDWQKGRDIFSLGYKFFIIQASSIILFSSGSVIAYRLFDAESVVVFNIPYKLFSIITFIFSIISANFWVSYAEAWKKGDVEWIKGATKKLFFIWLLLAVAGLLALVFSNFIFNFWIADRAKIPFSISLSTYLYVSLFTFGGIFNTFINATGKIQLQWICLALSSLVFVPLVILLNNTFELGVSSIWIALIISNFYSIIVAPIQYYLIISKKARGIFFS